MTTSEKFEPIEGALNTHVIVEYPDGARYLKRYPKNNPYVFGFIAHEQHFLGFTDLGGKFRRRSPKEQEYFTKRAVAHGLRVLPPSYIDENGVNYYRLLSDVQTFDKYLPKATYEQTQKVTLELFNDLRRAHSLGFVYGDRWSENMLVSPKYGLIHIDFDIEILGPASQELEVAQAIFYTLCGGKDNALLSLSSLLRMKQYQWFNFRLVEQFTTKLAIHFKDHKTYGNALNNCITLFDNLQRPGGQ